MGTITARAFNFLTISMRYFGSPSLRFRRRFALPFTLALVVGLVACDNSNPAPTAPPVRGSVAGRITVEGSALQGITVQLSGSTSLTTTSAADGSYSFAGLAVGTYAVTLSGTLNDYAFSAQSQTVEVRANARNVTADFTATWVRTAQIVVNVRRADGSGVLTNVELRGEGEDRTIGTNAQGTATFSELKRGSYAVRLPSPPESFVNNEQQVSVATGQAVPINFVGEVELVPPEISISSVVEVTPSGSTFSVERISAPVRVLLAVQPNGNAVDSLELHLVDPARGTRWRVAQQGPGESDALAATRVDELSFSFEVNPVARRLRDGSHPVIERLGPNGFEKVAPDPTLPYHPLFVDGAWQLWAVLHAADFDEPITTALDVGLTSVPAPDAFPLPDDLRFDHAILRISTDNTDWLDPMTGQPFPSTIVTAPGGELWISGDVHVDAFPVIYSEPSTAEDPWVAEMGLGLDSIDAGVKPAQAEPGAPAVFSWLFCENDVPNHDPEAVCDASVQGVLDSQLEPVITTATRSGTSGFTAMQLRFADNERSFEPFLRLDNQPPAPGGLNAEALPHPANEIEGVFNARRTQRSGPTRLGWVTWTDSLGRTVVDPGFDADSTGIGMSGTLEDQPHLLYVIGPDAPRVTVPADAPALIVADESARVFLNEMVGSQLAPETDHPELVELGSALGTPFSDAEDDYYLTAVHWDRFGNRIAASASGELAGYLQLGVDGAAPVFVDAGGAIGEPVGPIARNGMYNPYDDGRYVPSSSLDDGGGRYGDRVVEPFAGGPGSYRGFSTDRGRGFAGIEGVAIEDWRVLDGGLAATSRFGWAFAQGALLDWTFSARGGAANSFTIAAYAQRLRGNIVGNGYRDHRAHGFDRAGNVTRTSAMGEHIVDQSAPTIEAPGQPAGPYRLGQSYTFGVPLRDDVDLKRSDAGPEFIDPIFADLVVIGRPHGGATTSWGERPEQPSLMLPVVEHLHTPWGSSSIERDLLLSVSVPMNVCLSVFDRDGYRTTPERAPSVAFRTWDHASPYGLTAYRSLGISAAYAPDESCFDPERTDDNLARYVSRDLVWNFEVDTNRRPVVTLGGASSVFVPEVSPEDLTLYYQDIAGRLRRVDPTSVSWSLVVSDTGGNEEDARSYRYTFTGELPGDLIASADASAGTRGGFTFTWNLGGGNQLIWSEGWPRDPIQ